MPLYGYKGVGAGGKTVSGVLDADSPKGLRQALRKDGVVVTSFAVKKGKGSALGAGDGLKREVELKDLFTRVTKAEVATFTRQMATLLRSGIPLAESLGALFEQADNVKLKSILGDVKTAINEGRSFADSLGRHPHIFDELYVSMVRAGETAGNLDEVLRRLAEFMESGARLRSKVQGALIYPIIMLLLTVIIVGVLMVFVVPQITEIFTEQGLSLPIHTRILVGAAGLVSGYWWLLAILAAAAGYGFRAWTRSEGGRPVWHRFTLQIPMVGPLLRQVAVSRFARTVGTMLESGVPMLHTLEVSKTVLGNVILEREVAKARIAVSEGEALATALGRSGKFPPTVLKMIAVGERSGTLEQMLISISEAYDSEIEIRLDRFTAVLEPMMLVGMGGMVAFVVFSILTPLLEMQRNMASF
jgi:general secretion pathway protein F